MMMDIPVWLALLVSFFLLLGTLFTFLGIVGLIRLHSFFDRAHAPTLGTTFGSFLIICSSIIFFSYEQSRFSIHEILLIIFISITTPIMLSMLGSAAFYYKHEQNSLED